ncbi:MAG: helix-turn-helix transcriptional regulator [Brachyspira sp.]|nr:helix-turn-helix transcriptional regulator [Brachyspira sp.]
MNDDNILKVFGFNLKVLRMKKGLTQFQLAEKLNVHEKHICKIETGKQNVTLKTLEKIAKALEVEPSVLLENK